MYMRKCPYKLSDEESLKSGEVTNRYSIYNCVMYITVFTLTRRYICCEWYYIFELLK